MDVKVYTTSSCPWCKRLKDFLRTNHVVFEEIDVGDNPGGAQEMMKASKQMGVPVTVVADKVIVGFDETELKIALEL